MAPHESTPLQGSRQSRRTSLSVADAGERVSAFFDLTRFSAVSDDTGNRCSTVDSEGVEVAGKASMASSTFNMMNSILGTGILALPKVYAKAGFATGTVYVLVFALLSMFTKRAAR